MVLTPSNPNTSFYVGSRSAGTATWTDYDGDSPYVDWRPGTGNLRGFEAGTGRIDPWTSTGSANSHYYVGDMLGTTRHMGKVDGAPASGWGTTGNPAFLAFTAFGERVGTSGKLDGESNRYGYVGAHGYQAHDSEEMPFLHLGARYYDPSSGRFLQRDPIGVKGGMNVYGYANFAPTLLIDPDGLHYQDAWSEADRERIMKKRQEEARIRREKENYKQNTQPMDAQGKLNNIKRAQFWLELPSWVLTPPVFKIHKGLRWAAWCGKGVAAFVE